MTQSLLSAITILALGIMSGPMTACAGSHSEGELFHGLRNRGYDEIDRSIMDRLAAKSYEIGAPEAGLEAYLADQGMETSHGRAEVENSVVYGSADGYLRRGICGIHLSITWRADVSGKLTELSAVSGSSNCP